LISEPSNIQSGPPFLVGVGGWAYLPIKKGNKLAICAKLYDFVEVNSTFYDLPLIDQVKKWRQAVPDDFEFTVRANKILTHESHLEPTNKNFKIFDRMSEICRELRSTVLHFQFPPSLKMTDALISQWDGFFGSASKDLRLRFAIEMRSDENMFQKSARLRSLIEKYDIIVATDPSRSAAVVPSSSSRIVYSRVFGAGEHTKWTFDSDELTTLAKKIEEKPAHRKYVTFHNLTMYEDASRMKTVVKTGKDQELSLRSPVGLDSLKRAISSGRLVYPATKLKLISEFGWKIYDSETAKKEHVSKALGDLAEKQYSSPEEVIGYLANKEKL
jgi:uncharacterized protein YecE (DUF72 family)